MSNLQSPTSTHFDLYAKNMVVDNQLVSVEIWDTAGNIDLHQLEKLSYLNWDAVFLCFNLTSQRSLQNAYTKVSDSSTRPCEQSIEAKLTNGCE